MSPRTLPAARGSCRMFLLAVCATLAGASSAGAASPSVLSPTADSAPGIAIDAAGTAHVAFGTKTGASYPYSYKITYCQVPRGGTACTNTRVLNNPGNLNNFGATQVLVKGSQVVILQSMCCGGGEGTIMWKSTNGGATFPPPAFKVFNEPAGFSLFRSAQNQAGTGALVNDSAGTRVGFVGFDGSSSAQSPPQLGGSDVLGRSGVGWLNSTTPFTTQMGYLTNHLFTRVFNSATTGYNTAANWLPATKIDTKLTESAVATGPAGAFIAATTTVDHPFGMNEIAVYKVSDSGVASAPAPVIQTTPGHSPTNIDLVEDDGGRVHLAWTDTGFDGKLFYEWTKDGVTWSPPILIQLDPASGGYDNRIAVAADGGGWILTRALDGGPITIAPLEPKGAADPPTRPPPPAPPSTTPPPGSPPPVPGPAPAPACPQQIKVTADAPAVVRSGACFVNEPKGSGTFTTTGAIRVAGVDLVPLGAGKLTLDTKAGTIRAAGAKYEVRGGATVLARSTIDWDLTKPITISGVGAFGVKLFGLGVAGKADIWFTKGEGRIQVNLELPSPMDAVNANTVLTTTMTGGLIVDGFTVNGHDVPIGPVNLSSFHLAYSSGADALEGAFAMRLPPGASDNVTGGIGLANGSFKHAELEIGPGVPPLPLPLFAAPPITLQRIGAAASNDAKGFSLAGKIGLVAGGEIAGTALVGVDGTLTLFVPASRAYAQIRAEGLVKIVGVPLGGGFVQIRTDGPLTFGGSMNIDFAIIDASFSTAGGINLANGDFYASGTAHVGVNLVAIRGSADASSIVSSVGLAACGAIKGEVPGTGLSATIELGFQKPWGKSSELGACEIDKYIPASLKGGGASRAFGPLTSAAQVSGRSLRLKPGKLAGVKISGAGGRPGFTFSGANGRSITVPPNMTEPVVSSSIAAVPVNADSVELQVRNPGSGIWTVTPDGSAPATRQVFSAGVLPKPATKATVRRGRGAERVLSVSTANLGPQSLLLRERLPGGAAHEIGRITANGRQRVTFIPAMAAAGRRTIEAVVLNGNRVVGTRKVARYTAPRATRLPPPRRVTFSRKRSGRTTVTVAWKPVTGAASYRINVRASDGRRESFTAKRRARSLKIPNVTFADKLTVNVQAIPKLGPAGRTRTAVSKAVKLKKPARKKAPARR